MSTSLHRLFSLRQRHPNPSLQQPWNLAQIGVLLLPFSPSLGALALLLAALQTWRQQFSRIVRRPINQGLALLGVWLVFVSCFAANPTDAWLGLFNFLPFFWLFTALSALIQTSAQLRRLAWLLVLTSLPVVIIGFAQWGLGWGGDIRVLGIVLNWHIQPWGNPPGRMASVFEYANVLGSYLVVTFLLGLGLWIETWQKLTTRSLPTTTKSVTTKPIQRLGQWFRTTQGQIWLRWGFLSLLVIANGAALVLTNSRNAWTIAVLGGLVYALYVGWHWLVAAVGVVTGSVLWASFGPAFGQDWLRKIVPAFFWARLSDQLYPNRPLAQLRTTQWQFAWNLTQQRPWTGWGLRNFTPLYEAQMQYWVGHPHNLFLMLTAETGVPATLLLCGLVGWALLPGCHALRTWSMSSSAQSSQSAAQLLVLSYLIVFLACTLFHTLDVPMFDLRINLLGWLLLAAICGWGYHQQEAKSC